MKIKERINRVIQKLFEKEIEIDEVFYARADEEEMEDPA